MFLRPVTPRVRPKPSEGEGAGILHPAGAVGAKKSSSEARPRLEISASVTLVFATSSTLWLFCGKGSDLVVPTCVPASSSMKWQWLQAYSEKGLGSLGKWWATRQGKRVCSDCPRLAPGLHIFPSGPVAGMHGQWSVNRSDKCCNPLCHTMYVLCRRALPAVNRGPSGSALGRGACGLS